MPTGQNTQSLTPEQAAAITNEYIRRVSDHTARAFSVFRRLAAKKRMTFNHGGAAWEWPVKFALPEPRPYRRNQLIFQESRKHVRFSQEYATFYAGDALDMITQLEDKGPAAIINRRGTVADDLRQAMQQKLYGCLYSDGGGQYDYPYGLETFGGTTGTPTTADKVVQPSDTYAGYSTALQTFRGTWDNAMPVQPNHELGYDWPDAGTIGSLGVNARFDATSPKMVNTYCSNWTSGKTGVSDNLEECLTAAAHWITTLAGEEAQPDIAVMSGDWYRIYDQIQKSKYQITVPHTLGQDVGSGKPLRGWNADGMFITTEFGVPASRAYVMNTSTMGVRSRFGQLFEPKGPHHEFRTQSDLWAIFFSGQFEFQPRQTAFVKDFVN